MAFVFARIFGRKASKVCAVVRKFSANAKDLPKTQIARTKKTLTLIALSLAKSLSFYLSW